LTAGVKLGVARAAASVAEIRGRSTLGVDPVGLVGRLTRALDVQGRLLDVVAEREVIIPDLDHVALVEGDRAFNLDSVDLDAVVTL
jgi:hypothetical protein